MGCAALPWAAVLCIDGEYRWIVTSVENEPASNEAERLIRAAWDVLARTGFEGFKVASVIRAAGSSTKAFYRHFGSKDAMLLALLLDETQRASVRFATRIAAAASPTEAVRIWVSTMIGAAARPDLAARARLFASLGQISGDFPDQIIASREPMFIALVQILEEGRISGELPLADPEPDAALVMTTCGGVLRDQLDGTSGVDLAAAIANTQSLLLRAFGATLEPST